MTPKQERFVQECMLDLNATQAAIRTGYSTETARASGCELAEPLRARPGPSRRPQSTSLHRYLKRLSFRPFGNSPITAMWRFRRMSERLSPPPSPPPTDFFQTIFGIGTEVLDPGRLTVTCGARASLLSANPLIAGRRMLAIGFLHAVGSFLYAGFSVGCRENMVVSFQIRCRSPVDNVNVNDRA